MQLTFRTKLLILVFVAAFAFLQTIVMNFLLLRYSQQKISSIENYYLPKLQLEEQLKNEFRRLNRKFQDSVAAADLQILEETVELKDSFVQKTISFQNLIKTNELKNFNKTFLEYFTIASNFSKRTILGETGEAIINQAVKMQEKQIQVNDLIRKYFALNKNELSQVFHSLKTYQIKSTTYSLLLGIIFLVILFLLYMWINKDLIKSLTLLTAGLQRFGKSEFSNPIPILGKDDISQTAKVANEMAEKLLEFNQKQRNLLWLREGQSKLSNNLQGELSPLEVANSVIDFLTNFLDARVGGLYYKKDKYLYHIDSENFLKDEKKQEIGKGLIGQAALKDNLMSIQNIPSEYPSVTTGFGQLTPKEIVYLPLRKMGDLIGILELGFFEPCSEEKKFFLHEISEIIATALDVAISRTEMAKLLHQTQKQSYLLQNQEKKLTQSNVELGNQQQKLQAEKEKLEILMKELQTSRAKVEEKAKEAEQASRFKSQFLANMSHELRTPLNSIMVLSQLLAENKDKNLSPQQIKNANTIYSSGDDLLNLINDILDLSKIEANKLSIIPLTFPVQSLADDLHSIFKIQADKKGILFDIEVKKDTPNFIVSDQRRLNQILKNIISNAIKFTEKGFVKVIFSAFPENENIPPSIDIKPILKITIKDSGIGIKKNKLDLIFENFQQADNSIDRKYSGTGLGLAISKDLAKKLGGDIYVKSKLNHGSTFTLLLPNLLTDQMPAYNAKPIVKEELSQEQTDNKNALIYIIEDEDNFANILQEKCHDNHLNCVLFKNAEQALKHIEEDIPRAIILDIILPNMDGLTFLSKIRSQPKTKNIPTYIISIDSRDQEAKDLGATSFHQKPISLKELDQIMRELKELNNMTSSPQDYITQPNAFKGKTVLLAEDDVRSVFTLRQVLLPIGLEVINAENGEEVLKILETNANIDLVLMDIMMPQMDGLEAIKRIRKSKNSKQLPIIALTAKAMKEDRDECIKAGANDFITKPVDINQLILVLRNWLFQMEHK